ncbi:MAG: 2OG-Fe(II) oxygenase [Deltaproteobacteria bacterium]|nr:2OG-Fe(II) oxygenase [Deltaproteobacteria bacterium]
MTTVPFRFDDAPLLWTVPDVYDADECQEWIRIIEAGSPRIATNNPVYRDQDRVIRDDLAAASTLFERLRKHLPERLGELSLGGLNERLRMYRYAPGQRFAPHMDHWYRPTDTRITLLTVLVYLNDDFEGGETAFMEQLEETVHPKPGLVAIFQHKIRHEGCPVRSGHKYAIRSDVYYDAPSPIEMDLSGAGS